MGDQLERLKTSLEDRYVVERELGRGGMATVYLAYDPNLRRRVAIKVLHREVASAVGVERFEREIRTAAGLTHPRILPVHESGQADGLLYYVMPYVEGESLRVRLDREKQLPLSDALRIARQVARGLEHAHQQGVVHRDIKPANILLASGGAVIADFGIARAISRAGGESLTITGLTVGTPGYMSPEQSTGQDEIDGRSDLYSLGCVLYEMLVGEPPFTGRSPQVILARQMAADPSPVSTVRPTLPGGIDPALQRLLARVPADRFQTAGELIAALGGLDAGDVRPAEPPRRRGLLPGSLGERLSPKVVAVALVVAVVAAGVLWSMSRAAGPSSAGAELSVDTARYVVFPLEHGTEVEPGLDHTELLYDALARWRGISIVDPFQARQALEGSTAGMPGDLARLARGLGAGRFLSGSVSRIGDSFRVWAGLYDATADVRLIRNQAIRVPADLTGVDSLFAGLADGLLFPGSAAERATGPRSTRSLPARRAYHRGLEGIEAWNLQRADSAFSEAADLDPEYAQAHLWTALARAWRGAEPARWRVAVEQAALHREGMSERDRAITDALLTQARQPMGGGCRRWEEVTDLVPVDFAAWYGLAHCLTMDSVVVRDASTASGWTFRSSYHHALQAYQRAFELLPSILEAFRRSSFEPLRRLFMIAGTERRRGRAAAPERTRFEAEPGWRGDSLALVPHPIPEDPAGSFRHLGPPEETEEAVRRLRSLFHDVSVAWVGSSPRNGSAMEALAVSLGLLGNRGALDTLRRARSLAEAPDERLRIAGTEVWMRLSFALPGDEDELRRVHALADSLLSRPSSSEPLEPTLGAGLAALTGRIDLAMRYLRDPRAGEAFGAPPVLRPAAPQLLVLAVLGAPPETLGRLEREVRATIQERLRPETRAEAFQEWIVRPATLAFPVRPLVDMQELARHGDYLATAQAAWSRGDTAAVRDSLQAVQQARQHLLPETLTLDTLYPEAALLFAVGDVQEAAARLDPTLRALPQVAPDKLASPERVAALVRAAALRARIASRLGDREEARRWATAVSILWSDPDAFLEPFVVQLAPTTP